MARFEIAKVGLRVLPKIRYSADAYPDLRCTATSKTSGERCRRCRRPGWSVCSFHGAGGRDPSARQRTAPASGPRNEWNRSYKAGRRAARDAAAHIPPDVLREFSREWAHRLREADYDLFIVVLAARMAGDLGGGEWRRQLQRFGVY